jgi:predicted DCC family thiol-disulfide oxidoreductase YuxK
MDNTRPNKPIVFFDGHCILCGFLADWLIHRAKDKFYIASLQGQTAQELGLSSKTPDSIIFWNISKSYFKAEAVILLLIETNPAWRFLQVILFLPKSWPDKVYDLIASVRYKIFGQRSSCRIPTDDEKPFFLP